MKDISGTLDNETKLFNPWIGFRLLKHEKIQVGKCDCDYCECPYMVTSLNGWFKCIGCGLRNSHRFNKEACKTKSFVPPYLFKTPVII